MRRAVHLAIAMAALTSTSTAVMPADLGAATNNPIATPSGMVRFYFHALGTGQCDLAYKFAGRSSRSLSAFVRDCRTIRRVMIDRLDDPGYRLHPQTASYTCLAIRYTIYRRSRAATSYGGWYLMERTLGPAWSILYPLSHIAKDSKAIRLTRAQCASRLPSYVHPGAGTVVSGSVFLSAKAGWIALSTSGSYLPNGGCGHGIGSNCDSALTTIYRTADAGHHWTRLFRISTAVGAPVWIRLFMGQVGMVAATVGPLTAAANYHFTSALFSTRDGGRHWHRFPLPVNYATEAGSISFPDPRHGWLWCCGDGAAGSMAVYVYRTRDGGQHWSRVACTAFSNPTPGYGCPHPSGISLGGDKEDLVFKNAEDGWLTAGDNSGVPDIYYTADGGVTWRRQAVGLPASVPLPTPKSTVFPFGTLLQPLFFGRIVLLPEEVGFYRPKPRGTWSRLYVFRSADGGRTWQSALRTPVTAGAMFWQARDARHWLVPAKSSSSKMSIWQTDNGGASWTRHTLDLPSGLTLIGFQMSKGRDGWATAQTHADSENSQFGTVLLHTTDGGVRWRKVRLPGS